MSFEQKLGPELKKTVLEVEETTHFPVPQMRH
jgi:hypothetical protein